MKALLPLAALAALLLTACAGPPAPPPAPTAAPNPAPSAAPTAPAATALPTAGAATPTAGAATPAPGGALLPAPLYILEGGQIARIERDGATRAVITAEPAPFPGIEPITEFAIAPDERLAYIVSGAEADRLVVADGRGQNAMPRYEQQGHELSDLVFTPDGQALVLRLLNNREPPDLPSGLYRLPLAGGDPELLRPDDTPDDPVNPSRAVSGYRPVAFSPDGGRILLQVYALFYEDCGLGVIGADGGEVTRLSVPEGQSVYCDEEAWSADGSSVLFLAGTTQGEGSGPRLWRADSATGAAELLSADDDFARAPHGAPGGAARFFLADLLRDSTGAPTGATFAPAELTAPGAAPVELGPPFDQQLALALWAPDGAGVAVEVNEPNTGSALSWFPIGGDPVELASADPSTVQMAWGAQ
jgi:hypothetical protein